MAKNQNLDFNKFIPSSLKNETLSSLVSNLFNRFVSEEKSVLINGRIGTQVAGDAKIQAPTLDRELNALSPALYFKSGTEENVYTFDDLMHRLNALNADTVNTRDWMGEQSFNYSLPISYDKLINYSNYYWVAPGIPGLRAPSWNPNLDPEFYVIRRPLANNPVKSPVNLATTRHVNLWANDRPTETFTLTFTSSTTFTVTSNISPVITTTPTGVNPLQPSLSSITAGESTQVIISAADSQVAPGLSDPDSLPEQLCSFYIVNGPAQFSAGDNFVIQVTYFTSENYVSLNTVNFINKGTINGVVTSLKLMYIDGVALRGGERILVKNQNDPAENGIYRVYTGEKWHRTLDFQMEADVPDGSSIYVLGGQTQAGTTFVVSKTPNAPNTDGTVSSNFSFTADPANPANPSNSWQTYNFWHHKDDLAQLQLANFNVDACIQAQRPIIEYSDYLQLNSDIDADGFPTDAQPGRVPQVKTTFNQIPQFDLFRYDGTHEGSTSGIFFYVEDPDFSVDSVLQRRVKLTADSDFVFGVGIADDQDRLLYFKLNDALTSVWRPGVSEPTATTPVFSGGLDRGALSIDAINGLADNQDWTFTALSASSFSVYGSRSGDVGQLTVGQQFTCDDITVTISDGAENFVAGEKFTFSISAPLRPRYVKKLADGSIVNFPGGRAADIADSTQEGAWMTPLRMFQNLERETRYEVAFGDLINHIRNVIRNQDGFTGASVGNNNVRNLSIDEGLGGQIREFSSNFPLLASMLIQKDVSPLTMIDFAEQQYNVALSSIDQFLINELASYIAANDVIRSTQIDPYSTEILALEQYFEKLRGENQNLRDVFSDTTAGVTNWPTTLPMIGLLPKVAPNVGFDYELGIETIIHHDGHISPLATRDPDFDRNLVKSVVLRSDGTYTPGVFSETAPASPYARQLWMKPSVFELKVFDVVDDSDTPPSGTAGQFWYKKSTNQLYEWDSVGAAWVLSTASISSRWVSIDSAAIRNSLILAVENKLYQSVHPAQQLNIDLSLADGSQYAEIELAKFSAKYNYDTYAPDYVASDAFTWNYSSATISGMTTVPARWFDVYKQYFNVPGSSLPTCRPNIEPWKLLNHDVKPAWWDSMYASTNPGSANIVAPVRAVATSPVNVLFGLQTIDGVALASGDRVLITAQSQPQFNGIYIVSAGGWARSADVLTEQITMAATEGAMWAGSAWSLTTTEPITIGFTHLAFGQIRMWKYQMWVDIKMARPSMKLCVNIYTDALLPPYVSSTKVQSSEALLTVLTPALIAGQDDSYNFGDNGPIEIVWKKSLEHAYGLARSYFRLNPLEFLDKTWGETYIHVNDNMRVERNTMRALSPSKFLMHGERLNIVNNYTASEVASRIDGAISATSAGVVTFDVTHVADDLAMFYVYINGNFIGMIPEGDSFDSAVVIDGITIPAGTTITDRGIPFELGEKLIVTFNSSGVATYSHVAATVKKFKGTGQWFTNLLRFSYIDTDISPAALSYRGWELKLAHSIGALIRPDSLSINTAQGVLPSTAFDVILKRSTNTQSKWISALRIQVVEMGSKKLAPGGLYVPSADASDWIFRVETYNPQYPLAEYYELDTSSDFQTFFALTKEHTDIQWKHYSNKLTLNTTTTPKIITGLQNVINFYFGYVTRLEELGWRVNSGDYPITDDLTGRNIDWQLEIEKFIDSIFAGASSGSGYICNPFMQKVNMQTPVGLMSRFSESSFIDIYSMQAAFDVTGVVIPIANMNIIRTDEETTVYSSTPIFSAHVFIDEYEHSILMNKKISSDPSSATIFDPFLGQRIDTAYLTFIRQDATDRKPTFDGFFLNGNSVSRNITSSIDMIGRYYDAGQTFLEPKTADHAVALLGFTRKDYLTSIGINDTTQFNFWRGLISAKGTNMTIDAFVNYKKFVDASVDEYWAYKVAEYGDARERTFPEVKINPGDTTQKFTKLQFYTTGDTSYSALPLFTQIESSDDTRWYSIDDLGTSLKFEAQYITEQVIVPTTATFPAYIRLANIYHNGDSMSPKIMGPSGATIVNASLLKVTQPGSYAISGYTWLNPTKLSPIKLFDYKQKTLVDEIGLWHPAIGIHAAAPLELVNTIGNSDPALYNYTTQTSSNPNFRHLKPWAAHEVGKVWWDTRNLAYIPYYDATIFPNIDTRHSRWGSLAEWATVDLYQWTESTVPPAEYDSLAASQEGSSEIDARIRLSGTAALKTYYKRQRAIKTRPIAWSQVGQGYADGHPAFGSPEITVYVSGNRLIADKGTLASAEIVAGRNLSAWKNNKPVGEVQIGTDVQYHIGTESEVSSPVLTSSNGLTKIEVKSLDGSIFGTKIGKIQLTKKVNDVAATSFALRMSDANGQFEEVQLTDWYSALPGQDTTRVYKFNTFGLQVIATRENDGIITAEEQATAIGEQNADIYIRETVDFVEIIALPDIKFVNDELDPAWATSEYEWRTWTVPTQSDLDADLLYPHNTWQPYLGDETVVTVNAALVAVMKNSASSLTLKSGITINRFTSTWTEWASLESFRSEAISDGISPVSFTLAETPDVNRLSVYLNGIQMNPSGYVISGNTVQVVNIVSEGTAVTLLHRAYRPTDDELTFNPDVEEDVTIQTQYKVDFQYTEVEVRDEIGNITGKKYYFWVQDKTIPQVDKSMSLVQAKKILKEGPSTYTVFARLLADTTSSANGAAYDSCAISGLSSLVAKNDSFKLRFLRNFTLRDDPEEMNLKNVHTEWALIRRQQSGKIPESLWNILTDAICGQDAVGNPLPSQVRIDYDAKNNTNTRFGFKAGQVFADTQTLRESVINTILNTELRINTGTKTIIDYITALDLNESDKWFADAESARATMSLIWTTARPRQINEIFFNSLDDALVNNYEFSDMFKTSFITVNSKTAVTEAAQQEQIDELY